MGGAAAFGEVNGVCAGITKFSRAHVAEAWEAELARLFPLAIRRVVVPDYVVAFHGAIAGGAGVAVVAGTGSVVYGENGRGGAVRVGGRGWEFGDEGSGAHLTADAMRRTLRALDGLAPPTPLTRAVCDFLQTDDPAALAETARTRATENGRGFLVPLALALARSGDDEARNLFVGAAGWLAAYARAALTQLGFDEPSPVAVATIGGMWEAGDLLIDPFTRVLQRAFPHAHIAPAKDEPVVGALRLAARL